MWARVSRFKKPKDRLDEDVREARDAVSQSVVKMPGSHGVYYLVDRENGVTLAITLWDDEEAMRRSEEEADRTRAEASSKEGEEILSVERFEVALQPTDFYSKGR